MKNGSGTGSSVRVQRGCFVKEDKVSLCQALKVKGLRLGQEEKDR